MKLLGTCVFALLLFISCHHGATTEQTIMADDESPDSIMARVRRLKDPVAGLVSTAQPINMGNYTGARALGVLAYEWGYAMVKMEQTIRENIGAQRSNFETNYRAPLNALGWSRQLPTPADKGIVAPDCDAYHLSAVINLDEPYILQVPSTAGRYYVINIMDMYHNYLDCIGKRTTGTEGGTFAIVREGYNGGLPAGVKKTIVSKTSKVWLYGKLRVLEGENPMTVHDLQDQFVLKSLSNFQGRVNPGSVAALPDLPIYSPADSFRFYKQLALAVQSNPATDENKLLAAQLENIGIRDGSFNPSLLTTAQLRGLKDAAMEAPLAIIASQAKFARQINGWSWVSKPENFDYNYSYRSFITGQYMESLPDKEALFSSRNTDDEKSVFSGYNNYKIHFDGPPPVDGFWSLTLYVSGSSQLYGNELKRYKISSETAGLKSNADGSFDILIQHAKPNEISNWLPAPEGQFYLVFRLYEPKEEVLALQYNMPQVAKTRVY